MEATSTTPIRLGRESSSHPKDLSIRTARLRHVRLWASSALGSRSSSPNRQPREETFRAGAKCAGPVCFCEKKLRAGRDVLYCRWGEAMRSKVQSGPRPETEFLRLLGERVRAERSRR